MLPKSAVIGGSDEGIVVCLSGILAFSCIVFLS
jgi:hypothetical protein